MTANKAHARPPWRGTREARRGSRRAAFVRGGGRRRHPDHQDAARGARRQPADPHLRNPERHLQFHPDPDGGGREPTADALKEAQDLGYAEADPSFDVEGLDAAQKLAILTSVAFGTEIDRDSVFVEGISSIEPEDIAAAEELGYRIKLLGVAQRTESGIEQRVHPTMVPRDCDIARISGVTNAVAVEGDFIGSVILSGPGAGGNATASAVVGDIIDLARGLHVPPLGRPAASLQPYRQARMQAHEGGYYLRLKIRDKPGAFAAIARRMADAGISLNSILQRNRPIGTAPKRSAEEVMPVTIITHSTTEQTVRGALANIEADGGVFGRPQMIRIEAL